MAYGVFTQDGLDLVEQERGAAMAHARGLRKEGESVTVLHRDDEADLSEIELIQRTEGVSPTVAGKRFVKRMVENT